MIFGIDPGYAIVGWGCVKYERMKFTPLGYGTIRTPPEMTFDNRLEHVYRDISALLLKSRPDAVAIEKLFFTTNQKTAIDVAQARGVTVLAIRQSGAPVYEYTPLQVKSAVTGYGKADKQQVMEMTRRLLSLDSIPRPDDAADALAIAICHGQSGRSSRRFI